jgi:hypothetical protein
MAALASSPAVDRVSVFASHPLPFPDGLTVATHDESDHDRDDSDDGVDVIALRSPNRATRFAGALFSDVAARESGTEVGAVMFDAVTTSRTDVPLRFLEAPDTVREIELVATRVRALIDTGTDPARIAVVARQARPTIDEVATALGKVTVPVTARRRIALAQTGPARAVRAVLSVAAESYSRHAVLELADHPLLPLGLDSAVLNTVGLAEPLRTHAEWTSALERLLARCRSRDDVDARTGSDEADHEPWVQPAVASPAYVRHYGRSRTEPPHRTCRANARCMARMGAGQPAARGVAHRGGMVPLDVRGAHARAVGHDVAAYARSGRRPAGASHGLSGARPRGGVGAHVAHCTRYGRVDRRGTRACA